MRANRHVTLNGQSLARMHFATESACGITGLADWLGSWTTPVNSINFGGRIISRLDGKVRCTALFGPRRRARHYEAKATTEVRPLRSTRPVAGRVRAKRWLQSWTGEMAAAHSVRTDASTACVFGSSRRLRHRVLC